MTIPFKSAITAPLLAFALAVAAPSFASADGAVRMNFDGIEYAASGGNSNSVGALKDGVVMIVGGFQIVVKGNAMTIGDKTLDLPANVRAITARANGWALEVDVNGQSFHRVAESEGIETAGDGVDPAALNDLGVKYMKGDGVKRDPARAIKFYTKAAERGNVFAQSNLAFVYWEGDHVAKDPKKAVEWAEKAAAQGNDLSMWLLGTAYADGIGVATDKRKGVGWFIKAAKAGNAASMNNLGVHYWNGDGLKEDRAKAVYWYRRAMDNGSIVAVSNLGEAYRDGEGVSKSERKAEMYFEAASRAGNKSATTSLVALRQKMGKSPGLGMGAKEEKKYWFSENNINIGPLTLSVLKIAIREDRVHRDDMIWTSATKWQRARRFPEVNRLF